MRDLIRPLNVRGIIKTSNGFFAATTALQKGEENFYSVQEMMLIFACGFQKNFLSNANALIVRRNSSLSFFQLLPVSVSLLVRIFCNLSSSSKSKSILIFSWLKV
ncbi:hypothetical protein AVEN_267758-1 [Araneus ventricosus]|uniref:Uncharacterized protein n=1 Tax=Araneus ventricosus TaxID=182803 RepID=A0A4Y2J996_ARAVE|nr:hypothetical protein AVEN_242498-1 [Araneus ventricosus]GBM85850.1 hypothetical protein AVEN_267758-1 [Araneus ventricosus]